MFHFDWIRRHAERTPEKLALVDAASEQTLSYTELDRRINRFSSFLRQQLGVQAGDRVSILAMNSASYYEILFACSRLGAILNTLNWRLAAPELAYILQDCSPKVLIYDAQFAPVLSHLLPTLGGVSRVVLDGQAPGEDWTYEAALSLAVPKCFQDPGSPITTPGRLSIPRAQQDGRKAPRLLMVTFSIMR